VLVVGKLGAVHGVKGWLRLFSGTEPPGNIFAYQPWVLATSRGQQAVEVVQWRSQGDHFLVSFRGIDNREQAQALVNARVQVPETVLPELQEGEFYWHQLEGLKVVSNFGAETVLLGRVFRLQETGSNDVLVVRGCKGSLDGRERLIPWVDHVVHEVSLGRGEILVDWDPAF
jgi:16S rRNA processing protein RimM